ILASGVSTFALANNILQSETITIVANDDFKEIAADKIPAAITDAIAKDFASATISKAYVNSSEQYKIELTIDENTSTVYADKDGNWLKEADVIAKNKKEGETQM